MREMTQFYSSWVRAAACRKSIWRRTCSAVIYSTLPVSPTQRQPLAQLRFSSASARVLAACGGGSNIEPLPRMPQAGQLTVNQPPAQAQSGISLRPVPAVQLQDDQGAAVAQAGVR